MRLRVIAAVLGLVALAAPAWAAGPTLNHCIFSWTQEVTADLAGFRVKLATTAGGPYTVLATIPATAGGAFTTGNLCAPPLAQGQKYAVVTAFDAAGNESANSNEVPFVYDGVAPATPASLTVN